MRINPGLITNTGWVILSVGLILYFAKWFINPILIIIGASLALIGTLMYFFRKK